MKNAACLPGLLQAARMGSYSRLGWPLCLLCHNLTAIHLILVPQAPGAGQLRRVDRGAPPAVPD